MFQLVQLRHVTQNSSKLQYWFKEHSSQSFVILSSKPVNQHWVPIRVALVPPSRPQDL